VSPNEVDELLVEHLNNIFIIRVFKEAFQINKFVNLINSMSDRSVVPNHVSEFSVSI
jgi:hypothetical protein